MLTSSIQFSKYDARSDDWVQAHPPSWLVEAVAVRGEWPGIRPLAGVVDHPVLRPDGSVLDRPGYDGQTGLLYEPQQDFPQIPEHPTREDAAAAAAVLLDYVGQFPFLTEAHRSAWLTIPLTLVARPAIAGCTPLVLFDANSPGIGKTLGAEVGAGAITGMPLPKMAQAATDDETRKRITTLAIDGESVVLIDNVVGALGGPSLDAALTATEWSDRLLGVNQRVRVPLRMLWIASGNNATLAGDLLRRTLHVRLETSEERPEERTGWKHQLPSDVFANRPRLVVAALTMLRAHAAAGHPTGGMPSWGSFEDWSRVVRGAIVYAGLPDPAETRHELAASADTTTSDMYALLDALAPHITCPKRETAAELCKRMADDEALAGALTDMMTKPPVTARKVGKLFTRYRNRVFGGRAIVQANADAHRGALWTIQSVTSTS
jgi:hypothetical protein